MIAHYTFDVTDENFQEQVLKSDTPVLLDFGADWCPPCRMLEPIVDELAKKYDGKLRVGKIDSDANPNTPDMYNVMGYPTLLLFKGGKPVLQLVGYKPRHQLESAIEPYL